ncbi:hypothetical protein Bpro_0512 [Polaromonas sp. JS666]|nr:hypothetical protein Bpro_0512 [Polaromonas sp. JS666]
MLLPCTQLQVAIRASTSPIEDGDHRPFFPQAFKADHVAFCTGQIHAWCVVSCFLRAEFNASLFEFGSCTLHHGDALWGDTAGETRFVGCEFGGE